MLGAKMNSEPSEYPVARRALETVRRILIEIGWEPETNDEWSLWVDFGHPHVPVAGALAAIAPTAEQFIFYLVFGSTVPEERRNQVARFITLANWDLSIGNFEMNYDDGGVRFKSSIDFAGEELREAFIRNAILSAMRAVETYADPMTSVVNEGANAMEAIRNAEAE